ncbi:hypothetical protein OUHCRE1_47620 [Enterobacter asburiae]
MSFEIKINNEKEWKEVNINGLSYVISNYGDVVYNIKSGKTYKEYR